jgi:hypothetical protein
MNVYPEYWIGYAHAPPGSSGAVSVLLFSLPQLVPGPYRLEVRSRLPLEAGRVYCEESDGKAASATLLHGTRAYQENVAAHQLLTARGSGRSAGRLELVPFVVDPVAGMYPVLVVPVRVRVT